MCHENGSQHISTVINCSHLICFLASLVILFVNENILKSVVSSICDTLDSAPKFIYNNL